MNYISNLGAKIKWGLEKFVWRRIVKIFYGSVECDNGWYMIKNYLLWQKIFRINGEVPWLVHPSSKVTNWQKIKKKENCLPGYSIGNYIQAENGIELGRNVLIGPNVGIISANHSKQDLKKREKAPPIRIGDNVWIGMNSVILPGIQIGSNVIIGAGSIVTKDIPDYSVAAGNPCKIISRLES